MDEKFQFQSCNNFCDKEIGPICRETRDKLPQPNAAAPWQSSHKNFPPALTVSNGRSGFHQVIPTSLPFIRRVGSAAWLPSRRRRRTRRARFRGAHAPLPRLCAPVGKRCSDCSECPAKTARACGEKEVLSARAGLQIMKPGIDMQCKMKRC